MPDIPKIEIGLFQNIPSVYSVQNLTMMQNVSCEDIYETWIVNSESETVKWILAITAILITMATVIFNAAVIIRLRLKSKHKYFTKFFITSLAIADVFVGITVVPFSVGGLFFSTNNLFGELTCDLAISIDIMLSTVSIYHLLTLAFERFIALFKPLSYSKICNKKTRLVLFILNWSIPAMLAFGTVLPKLHERGVEHITNCFKKVSPSCTLATNFEFTIVATTISIFLPMLLLLSFNTCVCIIVRRQTNFHKGMMINRRSYTLNSRRTFSKETRIAITVGIMTGVFILCWLPFFIFNIISATSQYKVPGTIFLVCTWLGYANSAANPIVFLVLELRK